MTTAAYAASFCCAAQQTAESYSVKGVVQDSVSHQPIARVLIEANTSAVLTDNDGHFELNLSAGVVQIRVRRPGYDMRGSEQSHVVRVGTNMPDLVFTLTPQAIITGHVTLSTGDEADGIRIMAYRRQVVNGHSEWATQGIATTNSDGTFRLANLEAPATYLLYSMPAHDRIGHIAAGAVSFGYPSVYYPGVSDFSTAGQISLSPGQQAQADFTLTQQPFYPVSFSMDRRMGIQIHDISGRTIEASTRWNAERGVAEINLPSGRYYAESRTPGEASSYARTDFTVAGGPVSGLTLIPVPLRSIPVEVRRELTAAEGGTPDSGVTANDNGIGISLPPADTFEPPRGSINLRSAPGSDGSHYVLESVMPGRYWVEPFVRQGYVSAVTSGGVDLLREPLVVGAASSSSPINVTVRNDSGTITGSISQTASSSTQLGESSQVYICAIPLSSTSRIPNTFLRDSNQFSLAGVPPGSYRVLALDRQIEVDPSDAQAMAKYAGKGQTVTVDPNGTANVQLDVIQTASQGSEP